MSYPAYPNYKDSGVDWLGKVPAHWEVKRLRYVAELNPSKTEVRTLPAERSVSFIPMEAVGEDGSLSLVQTRQIGEVLAGYTYVREGDVTIAKITPCFENGKGAVMRGLKNHVGFGTTELIVLRPQSSLTTSEYLYRVVSSEPFRVLGESSMYGAGGQKRVPDDFVRNFKIAWPPYKEQVEIQAFLNHEIARIDALVEEQQRLIELLKEKRQAVISHAVTKGLDPDVPMKDSGVEWLGGVPEHWEVLRIGSVYVEAADKGLPELPVLRVSIHHGVSDRELNEEESDRKVTRIEDREKYKRVRHGDLVYNMMRAWQGGFGAVLVDGLVSPAYVVARPKLDDVSEFIEQLLRTANAVEEMRSRSYGITDFRLRLYWENFKNLKIALPPREERQEIVNWLKKIIIKSRALESEADKNISFLEERRSALISAAVTGKIDVRGWQAAREADPSEMLMAAEERATYG